MAHVKHEHFHVLEIKDAELPVTVDSHFKTCISFTC